MAVIERQAPSHEEGRGIPTERRARFPGFDGLRAVAAALIVVHHAGFASGVTLNRWWGVFTGRMDIGVSIFFVISGFLLYRPFVVTQLTDRPAPDTKSFYWRRFLRIFPAYWAALVVMLLIGGIIVRGPVGFFFSATLLHSYNTNRAISGITQSWSLAAEIAFYAVLPVLVALSARWLRGASIAQRATRLLTLTVAVYGLSLVWRIVVHEWDPTWESITPQWFLSVMDQFALGMALAVISVWGTHNRAVHDLNERVGTRTALWWGAAVAMFWFTATQLDLAIGLERSDFLRETIRQGLYGLIGFALVAPLALAPESRERVRKLLDNRVLAYLGVLSYGIYLWHQFFIYWIPRWFDWPLFSGHFIPLVVGAFVLSAGVAHLSYRLVEQPANRLRGRADRRAPDEGSGFAAATTGGNP